MGGEAGNLESGFDLKQASRLVSSYNRVTGVNCRIIDNSGNSLFETSCGGCDLCSNNDKNFNKYSCSDAHLYGGYQSEQFDGKYIFFCPIGLTYWASPIIPENLAVGYLIGGPVMMVDPEEFLIDEIISQKEAGKPKNEKLSEYIKTIPIINPDIVSDLSEMLFAVSSHISDGLTPKFHAEQQNNKIQSQISETIHNIKHQSPEDTICYPFEKEKELLSAVSEGDKPTSQKLLNEILGYIYFSTGSDIRVMKLHMQELVVLLSRAAIEGGADTEEIFGLNHNYLLDIDKFTNIDQLSYWLSKVLARFTDCVFNLANVRHKDAIFKAVSYIKKHYMEKLTLEEVAGYVYLNPSYFSKIFKEELGCTYISYLNNIRVSISKKLLLDSSVKLTDISGLVGYEEQSYYTKVFKKLAGMTPGLFRKSMGMKPTEKKK